MIDDFMRMLGFFSIICFPFQMLMTEDTHALARFAVLQMLSFSIIVGDS